MSAILVLKGTVPSKKNARRVARGRSFLPLQVQIDIEALIIQAQVNARHLDLDQFRGKGKRLRVEVDFYGQGLRKDLDNCFTTLLDVLQKSRVIDNDRMVRSFRVDERTPDGEMLTTITISLLPTLSPEKKRYAT